MRGESTSQQKTPKKRSPTTDYPQQLILNVFVSVSSQRSDTGSGRNGPARNDPGQNVPGRKAAQNSPRQVLGLNLYLFGG